MRLRGTLLAVITGAMLVSAVNARAQDATNSVQLTWTAPGDDSLSGRAAQYDLRYSTAPISAGNFAAATRVTGMPAPATSGASESFLIAGLSPNTTYWFAIKTADEVPNWSGLSNLVQHTTSAVSGDSIAPAPMAINVTGTTDVSVTIGWTAPGDDSLSGTAASYDIRWSHATITAGNWATATQASGEPGPLAAGTAQSYTLGGLDRSQDIYLAARARDDAGNLSGLSNVVRVDHLLDTAPPAAPGGLSASINGPGSVHLGWLANAEADLNGYHVYRALSASGPWSRLTAQVVTTNAYDDGSLADTTQNAWYQVTAVDLAGNESARSAVSLASFVAADISAWAIEPGYPNPSRLGDTVRFPVRVPASGPFDVTVSVLNGAGELVRVLRISGLGPGPGVITWDGRNDAGREVAPGVYRATVRVGGSTQVSKLVRQP